MSLWKIRGADDDQTDGTEQASRQPLPTASPPITPPPTIHKLEGESDLMANIGKSISIKGDVVGDEDTVIEGRVEGRIELKNHHLTVGPNGDVAGEIGAKQVTIVGRVEGNIQATERVELCDSGRLTGDITAPRLLVQEGAQFNGKVSMKAASATTQPAAKKSLDDRRTPVSRAPEANV